MIRPPDASLLPESDLPVEPERYEFFEEPRYRFDFTPLDLARRDFLKVLGGGIAICLIVSDSSAQQQGRGRGGAAGAPQELGAWLHIAEDGTVTVYSGKTEVGQNVRTSLTQAAAEELRLPVSSVRIVLADTDLVPFDGGTVGSQSTPAMVPRIRRAAAAARELLLDLAAERAKVDRATLTMADGKVIHAATKQSFTFGSQRLPGLSYVQK